MKGKKWSDLGRILGYRGIPGLSTQLKNSYTRVILPYEHYTQRARNSPTSPTIPPTREPSLKIHLNMNSIARANKVNSSAAASTADGTSPPGSPLTTTSSPLSEPPDESESKDKVTASRPRRSARMSSIEQCMFPLPSSPLYQLTSCSAQKARASGASARFLR